MSYLIKDEEGADEARMKFIAVVTIFSPDQE